MAAVWEGCGREARIWAWGVLARAGNWDTAQSQLTEDTERRLQFERQSLCMGRAQRT